MDASPLLSFARDLTLSHASALSERPVSLGDPETEQPSPRCPVRRRFLAACIRLENLGIGEGAVARRIFCASDLGDEIAVPDAESAGRIIRVLTLIDPAEAGAVEQARIAILAVCELLAPREIGRV